MSRSPRISVIVCANASERFEQLRAALVSVRDQSLPAGEIIAVIDHNEDLQTSVCAEFPEIRTLANNGNPGLSAARNTGVSTARGDVVAFMDDDAVANPDWLERLAHHYADPKTMGVGGRIIAVWPQGRPDWFPEEFDWVVGCTYRGHPDTVADVRNLIGCNMSFRRFVLEQTGGFDEAMGRKKGDAAGCEETKLCIRARHLHPDLKLVYDPDAIVHHHVAVSRCTWHYFRTRCLAEGRSKALVVADAGSRRGLASERAYMRKVLPAGFVRGLGDALLRGDGSGIRRAVALASGLGYVGRSYLAARLKRRVTGGNDARPFLPIRILDIDLTESVAPILRLDPDTGKTYGAAFCLVRDHGYPIGVVEVPLSDDDRTVPELTALTGPGHPVRQTGPISANVAEHPFVRVVVATRDRATSLADCLDTMLDQDYARFEIVVVDNAPSNAETADLIAARYASTGRVRYIRENRAGLGQAHNAGIADLDAPIAAFTDDDVNVDPQWLAALAGNFALSGKIGCVTGLILPAELETRAQYWTERHGGFGKGFERRVFDMAENRPADMLFPFAAGVLGSGANMAFSARALRRIGGFDPALGAGTIARGGDDLAGFVGVLRAGFQLVYEPEAIVWHHHRREEDGMRRQAYGYGVGLGAYLTKMVFDDPSNLVKFATAFPWALAHVLGPKSGKNVRLPDDFPAGLRWQERWGMLAGVPAYLRSRADFQRYQARQRSSGLIDLARH